MAVFKCKMCGGQLEITEGISVCTCEYCGTEQTIPKLDSDKKTNMYDRANHFRRNNDFDKAMGMYEQILNEDNTDAEAYWSLVLCRYGIEYVEDPAIHKMIPTVNRAQYTSIYADENYKSAIEYADTLQKTVYEQEAKIIDEIQKGILSISEKEEPFDVFICYKETDDNGRRTPDSVLANELYHQLTQEGFKVFFSRITLEDKLGQEYEPYIFAALNSSKVMVVLGTKPEYFNAVWVKNEWSRYLMLIKNGEKKILIPAYKDMDPYDLPEEFSHLQAQDMTKLGFMQDLIRAIKKIIGTDQPQTIEKETVVLQQNTGSTTASAQVQRGNMALEDHEWEKADSFYEKALNLEPQCAEAYLGKMLSKNEKPGFASWLDMQKEKYTDATTERLEACPVEAAHIDKIAGEMAIEGYLDENTVRKLYEYDCSYYSSLSCRKKQKSKQLEELASERLLARAQQYAFGETKKQLENGIAEITAVLDQRIAQAQNDDKISVERVKATYAAHMSQSDKKAEELNNDAQNRREQRYKSAVTMMNNASDIPAYENAIGALEAMNGYKDSNNLVISCQKEIDRLHEEKERHLAAIRKKEAERAAKKRKTIISIVSVIAVVSITVLIAVKKVIIPNINYNKAVALMDVGDYEEAITVFRTLDGYKDSEEKIVALESEMLKVAEVGSNVYFGSYEQDDNTSNGKEKIEWTVLKKEDNKILVISKYGLDSRSYNEEHESITWEDCSLRKWLNDSFIIEAFISKEVEKILTTTVKADPNPKYDTNTGNDTQDQVFLLSINEAEKYLSSDSARQCEATAYAKTKGAYTNNYNGNCSWWLRSPGYDVYYANCVYGSGNIDYGGFIVDHRTTAVRPALWISLE